MKVKIYPFLCSVLMLIIFSASGCGRDPRPVSQTGFYFDTVVTITLYGDDTLTDARAEDILNGCFDLCRTWEDILSRTKEGSDIWKINHAGGKPVKVHPGTAALLQKALSYCEATDGAVDITIAPLSDLWDFSSERIADRQAGGALPSPQQIGELLPHVDYRNVRLDGTTVTLSDPAAAMDLGCIAKGYIADRLKEYLLEQGITSAIIDLGGNILTVGGRPDGSPFRLGIQKPFDTTGTPIAALSVSDRSLVSSGVYERYFELDGTRYHHLLNTRTGMPQDGHLLSVTILSDSSADGDILSTACFLLGLEEGMAYVESLPDIEAVFITDDYELYPSSGLSGLVQKP